MVIEGFTPWSALIGGALIGSAAVLMMLTLGRIAGVSGIAGGLVHARSGDGAWRVAFLVGLPLGAGLYGLFAEGALALRYDATLPVLIIGGLLVGFGTRLGSGCTSGHGVCGIARLSQRSIVATIVFMVTAVVTVYIMRHVVGG
jgi:uncharacterized protein